MPPQTPEPKPSPIGAAAAAEQAAWAALLAAARWARRPQAPLDRSAAYGVDAAGELLAVPEGSPAALIVWTPEQGWQPAADVAGPPRALLDLYAPVCGARPARPLTCGHLGQSIDGYIATASGDSNYVTGPENILHLHRMRALSDAILVGAETVACDDPRLTARHASGDNPLRIVLDPRRRLPSSHRVFADADARTVLVCDQTHTGGADSLGNADVIGVPVEQGRLALEILLAELHRRGIVSVFVEGGGATVSRFFEAGLLDRLQIAVAPIATGAGRPGLRLAPRARMSECRRFAHRVFRMGADVLFDFDLRAVPDDAGSGAGGLERIL